MAMARAGWVIDPVQNDKRQAAKHEDHSHDQEDTCLERRRDRSILGEEVS